MQYKRIPLSMVEYTEIAEKCYKDYEQNKDTPHEIEIESEWLTQRKQLYAMLNMLTPR